MSTNSPIEWTDATWNPVTGCTRVSAGCDNCYAVRQSYRMENFGAVTKYGGLTVLNGKGDRHFNGTVKTHDDALAIPLKWQKPRRIFVNSMSDLFHRDVPFEFIDKVFAVMALCPQHTFQVLTKRPERMAEYLNDSRDMMGMKTSERIAWLLAKVDKQELIEGREGWAFHGTEPSRACFEFYEKPLPNVWLGSSAENQQAYDERREHLERCPAAVRFWSLEPLLGPIDFDGPLGDSRLGDDELGTDRIDWVIAGGESGPNARPMHPDWARSLRDQCLAAVVSFFFKQWGEWVPFLNNVDIPDGPVSSPVCLVKKSGQVIRPYTQADAPGHQMCRVGKKAAGRLLDGRTWDEMPKGAEVWHAQTI